MRTFEAALVGVSSQAAIETAARFTKGEVEGQSLTFAPTVAEFTRRAKQFDEMMARRNGTRLPPPQYRSDPRGLKPFEVKIAQAKAQYAHLPVLFEDVSYDRWKTLSASNKIPEGAVWVAALGTVYGPAPKAASKAA